MLSPCLRIIYFTVPIVKNNKYWVETCRRDSVRKFRIITESGENRDMICLYMLEKYVELIAANSGN